MPVIICSSGNFADYIPSGLTCIDISSLNNHTDITGKYVKAKINTKYILNTHRTSSIKLVIQSCTGRLINLHAFGPIATDLDSCTIGDTLVFSDFEVDVCPKDKRTNGPYQIILDDHKPVKSVVWVVKASQTASNSSTPAKDFNSKSSSSSTVSSPATRSTSKKQSPKNSKNIGYTYTLLKDVVVGTSVHIYGVVSYFKTAVKTSGSDYYMMINVVDPSLTDLEEKLSCNLFDRDKDKLPTQAAVGDVIRFHRLKIQSYQGKMQGRTGPGCHWVLFQGSYENHLASSESYTLQTIDKEKVCELLTWWEDLTLVNQGSDQMGASKPNVSRTNTHSPSGQSTPGTPIASSPTPSMSSILDQLTPMKVLPVTYKSLEEVNKVREHRAINLYAVVIYCRPAVRTVRGEYHLMLNITDPSLENKDTKLTCNLFEADKNRLPCQAMRGNIIRFHNLKITTYKGKKQGVKDHNFQWVLFKESFDNRIASCPDYIVKEDERTKVESLLEWWQEGQENVPFQKVKKRQYFDLVCQVIFNVNIETNHFRLLKVWDGTKFNGPILSCSVAGAEGDKTLEKIAGDLNLIHDVFLFDNHIVSAQNIKSRDYIKLTNLHAAVVNGLVEMTLHGGISYQRGVNKLNPEDRVVVRLKTVLDPLISKYVGEPSKKDDGSNGAVTSGPSLKEPLKNGEGSSCCGSTLDGVSSHESPREKEKVLGNNASTSRKRLFDEPSEFESQHKKCSNLNQSSETRVVDVIVISDSSSATSSRPNSNNSCEILECGSSFRKAKDVTTVTCGVPVTSRFSQKESNLSSTSPEFDSLTLPSSISSPPSSLNLTEKDQYYVEAVLAREKRKMEKDGIHDTTVIDIAADSLQEVMSGISSMPSESIELSMYRSSPVNSNGDQPLVRDEPSSCKGDNGMKDKDVNYLSGQKTNESKTKDKESRSIKSQDIAQISSGRNEICPPSSLRGKNCDDDLIEIDSSQESFHTAKDSSSPISKAIPTKQVSPSPSGLTNERGVNRVQTRTRRQKLEERGQVGNKRSKRVKHIDKFSSGSDEDQHCSDTNERIKVSRKTDSSCNDSSYKEKGVDCLEGEKAPLMPLKSLQLSPTVSQRKHLSLRSPSSNDCRIGVSSSTSISTVASHLSKSRRKETNSSSSTLKEGDDTVSSSGDSHYSIPNDSQPVEFGYDEVVSSSTDPKNSSTSHERDSNRIWDGMKETTVTASVKNQTRDYFKLQTFVKCKAPTKLRTRVRLCRYYPCTDNMSDFVQFCCFQCKYMISSSKIRSKRIAKCPNSCGELQPHILINMHLSDEEYEIKAMLWGQHAVEFFQGVSPQDLLLKTTAKDKVQNCLYSISRPDLELKDKPLLECCLFSYVFRSKMYFQIFDTVII